jgi:asparagine synthase (glutamine-hydrolysing)
MSGFFGILRADGREISGELLRRVADALRVRGSTGETIWSEPGAGTYFSYLENKHARQPAAQPARLGANWLLGDVRVDAREELIRQLAGRKEIITSDCQDEEILLRAWRCWGDGSLQRVIGDFSFALYEHQEKALWCARDFTGARPFFHAQGDGMFCFSNTLGALRLVPGISAELDEDFVADFLLHGYCKDLTRTVYAGIKRLPAGHLLKFHGESVEVRRFLHLAVEEPLRFSQPGEYVDAYRELLRHAVQDRLPQSAVALYLSGGLDSGSVCAVAAKIAAEQGAQERLKAFTISWRPLFEDREPHFATLTAEHLQLNHEILEEQALEPFSPRDDRQIVDPEPNIDPFFARARRFSRRIAAHSNVILSGDGGDDVLTGQTWPYLRKMWTDGEWQEMARSLGGFVWAHGTLPPLRMGLRAKLGGWFHGRHQAGGIPDWAEPEFARRNELKEKSREKVQNSPAHAEHPVHPQGYAALHGGFWSSILEGEDAGFMQVALETRAPLLDLRVLRFLLRVPAVPWCVNKELSRRAMKGDLPKTITERPKTPLQGDPLGICLRTGRWSPAAPSVPPSAIHNFIDWEKWVTTLKTGEGFNSDSNLFSLAFVLWLKDIENAGGIEYSVCEGRR